jgi:hypothetical protein
MDGNVLEAINCAVSVYDKHYMDRDLNRTGAAAAYPLFGAIFFC